MFGNRMLKSYRLILGRETFCSLDFVVNAPHQPGKKFSSYTLSRMYSSIYSFEKAIGSESEETKGNDTE